MIIIRGAIPRKITSRICASIMLNIIFSCVTPPKGIIVEVVEKDNKLYFSDLIVQAKKENFFKRDRYLIKTISLFEFRQGYRDRLVWHSYGDSQGVHKLPILPSEFTYGQLFNGLIQNESPAILKPGFEYYLSIGIVGENNSGKNRIIFLIDSRFKVGEIIHPCSSQKQNTRELGGSLLKVPGKYLRGTGCLKGADIDSAIAVWQRNTE